MFNTKDGFLEATVRGCVGGFLRTEDYSNLQQCETLEDIKLYLTNTDYGSLLQNEASPTHPSLIVQCCLKKIVQDFSFFEAQAAEPLSTFLQYLKYGYMIDNIVLMVTGAMHEREVTELLDKCHPLGMFDSIASLGAVSNLRELHRIVLVDTPISAYFGECFRDENLDEVNIEILRNSLYKAYLKDFFELSQMLGGLTAEVMKEILFFEADRRAVNITINSIGTELSRDDRRKLFSDFGHLHPEGHRDLALCNDFEQVLSVIVNNSTSPNILQKSTSEEMNIEKLFYETEVMKCRSMFTQQFHYGIFYAYLKLREQEVRNLMWLSECIAQDQKYRIVDGVISIL